jgi:hypothetical protein
MNTNEGSEMASMILGIIRGEKPLGLLPELGIHIAWEGDSYKLTSERSRVAVTPPVFDVAFGMLHYAKNEGELRKWAFFILAESGSIDLKEVESHSKGELLIDALWNASSKGRVTDEVIELARKIVTGSGLDLDQSAG